MKKNLAVFAALVVGMMLGATGMAAYYGPIAEIVAEVVPAPGGSSGGNGPASLSGTISLSVGQLVVGQHYYFDDVEGYTWLETGDGGSFDIVLSYNTSAFSYVRVKVEIESSSSHSSDDSESYYEFYLDTNNPSYTVSLPAGKTMKVKVELEEISVSPDASPGNYVIAVDLFGP